MDNWDKYYTKSYHDMEDERRTINERSGLKTVKTLKYYNEVDDKARQKVPTAEKMKFNLEFLSLIGPKMMCRSKEYINMEGVGYGLFPGNYEFFKREAFDPYVKNRPAYNEEMVGFPIAVNFIGQKEAFLLTDGTFRAFDFKQKKFVLYLGPDMEKTHKEDKEILLLVEVMVESIISGKFDRDFHFANKDIGEYVKKANEATGYHYIIEKKRY